MGNSRCQRECRHTTLAAAAAELEICRGGDGGGNGAIGSGDGGKGALISSPKRFVELWSDDVSICLTVGTCLQGETTPSLGAQEFMHLSIRRSSAAKTGSTPWRPVVALTVLQGELLLPPGLLVVVVDAALAAA